jgi:hypothetical protein
MALPKTGTLGQKVDYNGYTYQWTGVGWNNIGVSKIAVTNQVTVGNGSISGNNVSTANGISIGNTVVNSSISTNTIFVGDGANSTKITSNTLSIGNSVVNVALTTNSIFVGNSSAGVKLSTNNISIGNGIINTSSTSNGVTVANTIYNTLLTANGLSTGNSIYRSIATANGFATGNATSNTTINYNQIFVGNVFTSSRISGNLISVSDYNGNVRISSNTIFIGNSAVSGYYLTTNDSIAYFTGLSYFANLAYNSSKLGGINASDYISTQQSYNINNTWTFNKAVYFTNTAGVGTYTGVIFTDTSGAWFTGSSYGSLDSLNLGGIGAANYVKFSDLSSGGYMRNINDYTVSGKIIHTSNLEIRNTSLVINTSSSLYAGGSKGNQGQILVSTGSSIRWDDASFLIDQGATYDWTNVHSFSNVVNFNNQINVTPGKTINATTNNALYLNGTAASLYALKTDAIGYATSASAAGVAAAATAYANAMATTLTRNAIYTGTASYGSGSINTAITSTSISVANSTTSTTILNDKIFIGKSTNYANITNGSITFLNNGLTGSVNSVYYTGISNTALSLGSGLFTSVTTSGSGYLTAPTITLTWANGGTNTTAVSATMTGGGNMTGGGHVSAIPVTKINPPVNILPPVTISIPGPPEIHFNGYSAIDPIEDTITLASNPFIVGDAIKYYNGLIAVTSVGGLYHNMQLYVVYSVGDKIKVSSTLGGSIIQLTAGSNDTKHFLIGEAATVDVTVGGYPASDYLTKDQMAAANLTFNGTVTFTSNVLFKNNPVIQDSNAYYTNTYVFFSNSDLTLSNSDVSMDSGNLTITNGSISATNGGVFGNTISITNIALPRQYVDINGNLVTEANTGLGGQLLASNGSGNAYWFTVGSGGEGGIGTVYEVRTGDGLTGGPIVSQGSLSVLANTGIVVNTSGTFVNTTYIQSLDVHGSTMLGGRLASEYALLASPTFTGNIVISGNLTVTGNTVILGANNLALKDAVISLHTLETLGPLTVNDGRLVGAALHYYDTADKQALLALNQSNGVMTYWSNTTDSVQGDPVPLVMGTMQACNFIVGNTLGALGTGSTIFIGNNTVNATINATSYKINGVVTMNTTTYIGTANNSNYLGGSPASGYMNTSNSFRRSGLTYFDANVSVNAAIILNGSDPGQAGQVLTSNGTSNAFWSYASTGVTQVDPGNGLSSNTGGSITTKGTLTVVAVGSGGINVTSSGLSVFANGYSTVVNATGLHVRAGNGLTVNATGLHIVTSNSTNLGNTGLFTNSSGLFVNTAFAAYLDTNNAVFLGGYTAASYYRKAENVILTGNVTIGDTGTNLGTNVVFNSNATFNKFVLSNIIPSPNNNNTLGNTTNNWKSIYVGNTGGIYLGTARITQDNFGAISIPTLHVDDYITANTVTANEMVVSIGMTANAISAGTITIDNPLEASWGGTGIDIYGIGDMLYANSTTSLGKISIPTGSGIIANGQVFQIVNNLPVWGDLDGGVFDD